VQQNFHISSNFEQGKIGILQAQRPDAIELELLKDNAADFVQWFYFRVTGARGAPLRMRFTNALASNVLKTDGMPDIWPGYQAFASYDLTHWFLVPTVIGSDGMVVSFTPQQDSVYFAQYPVYPMQRHREFIARTLADPRTQLTVLGQTPDGQDLELLTIGTPAPGKKSCWVVTRQHPNEVQGSWCVEGLVERLLLEEDPVSRALLDKTVFHVVPNMNPDGSRRGNTRTNAQGVNLNREWQTATRDRAPEVLMVKQAMHARGVDFFLDVHAWSGTVPFALGPYHTPSITPLQSALWQRYEQALARANPEFQVGNPYPGGGPPPGGAYLEMSWNYVSENLGAFGLLYELIFKNNDKRPDPVNGWSAAKCKYFGHGTLQALHEIVDDLRTVRAASAPPAL
jgi:murein tripeptide amidase MpaA